MRQALGLSGLQPTFYQRSRRYLGNKYKLINFLREVVSKECGQLQSVCDAFAGTGVVGAAFNTPHVQIITNDLLRSNYVCLKTFLGTTYEYQGRVNALIERLNRLSNLKPNYFSENFGGTYFSEANAIKIGAIREEIERIAECESEKCILLCALLYATDKVANTVGHYDAYRKRMDTLAPIHLGTPIVDTTANHRNLVLCEDANSIVRRVSCDLLYLDPPYNSRQYCDAYHVLENLIEWRQPRLYGIGKKMDRAHIKSDYCVNGARNALNDLIEHADCRYIMLSYNNTGSKMDSRSNARITDTEITEILSARGSVQVFETAFGTFSTGRQKSVNNNIERVFFCQTHE